MKTGVPHKENIWHIGKQNLAGLTSVPSAEMNTWADPEGGTGGPNQIINFCHVEIFRQTPSGNFRAWNK